MIDSDSAQDLFAEPKDDSELEDPRDWTKPSFAVIACDGNGNGAVLWTAGPHVEGMMDDVGSRLDDVGLDNAPEGISVWSGLMHGGFADYADTYLEGAFREPTENEWSAIKRGECPWDEDDWIK